MRRLAALAILLGTWVAPSHVSATCPPGYGNTTEGCLPCAKGSARARDSVNATCVPCGLGAEPVTRVQASAPSDDWVTVDIGSSLSWEAVATSSDGRILAVHANDQVVVSDAFDRVGIATTGLPDPIGGRRTLSMNDDGGTMLLVGSTGSPHRTDDYGLTWTPLPTDLFPPNATYAGGDLDANGNVLAVARVNQGILLTDFSSNSSEPAYTLHSDPRHYTDIALSGDGTLVVATFQPSTDVSPDDTTLVDWDGARHNIQEVTYDGYISNTYLTAHQKIGGLIHEYESEQQPKLVDGLHASPGQTRYFWCTEHGMNPGVGKFAITCPSDGGPTGTQVNVYFDGQTYTACTSQSGPILVGTVDHGQNSLNMVTKGPIGAPAWSHVDLSHDGTVIAATVPFGDIYVSQDQGDTWSLRTIGSTDGDCDICSPMKNWTDISVSYDGTRILATDNFGFVWQSEDTGHTWAHLLEKAKFSAVAVASTDTMSPPTIFAVTLGQEIYTNYDTEDAVVDTAAISCRDCPRGEGSIDGNACNVCPSNMFAPVAGEGCRDHATSCGPAEYMGDGNATRDVCYPCPDDTYRADLSHAYTQCIPHSTVCPLAGHWQVGPPSNISDIQCESCADRNCLSDKGCADVDANGHVTLENGALVLPAHAFENCGALQTITVTQQVQRIGKEAFRHTGLTAIVLDGDTELIGDEAFADASNLQTVTLGTSVKSVGAQAFNNTKVTKVTVLNANTLFGPGALPADLVQFCGSSVEGRLNIPIPNDEANVPCYDCPADHYTTATYALDDSGCVPYSVDCPKGHFKASGNATHDVCYPCEAGTYQPYDNFTSDTCQTCQRGTWSGPGAAQCSGFSTSCGPGEKKAKTSTVNDMCVPCEAGTYQDRTNHQLWNCKACPPGQVSSDDRTRCIDRTTYSCSAGFYLSYDATGLHDNECLPCPSGQYQPDNDSPATGCLVHTACDMGESLLVGGDATKNNQCEPCHDGQYQDQRNFLGFLCKDRGAGIGVNCPAGMYFDNTVKTTDRNCHACPRGHYQPDHASTATTCTPSLCEPGEEPWYPSGSMTLQIDATTGADVAQMIVQVHDAAGDLLFSKDNTDRLCGGVQTTCTDSVSVDASRLPLLLTLRDGQNDGWDNGKLSVSLDGTSLHTDITVTADQDEKVYILMAENGNAENKCQACPAGTFQSLRGVHAYCTPHTIVNGDDCPVGQIPSTPTARADGCTAVPSCPADRVPSGDRHLQQTAIWTSACKDPSKYHDVAAGTCQACDRADRLSAVTEVMQAVQHLLYAFVCHDYHTFPNPLVGKVTGTVQNDITEYVDLKFDGTVYFSTWQALHPNESLGHALSRLIDRVGAGAGEVSSDDCVSCTHPFIVGDHACVCPEGQQQVDQMCVAKHTDKTQCGELEMFADGTCVSCPRTEGGLDGRCPTQKKCGDHDVHGRLTFEVGNDDLYLSGATHVEREAFDSCETLQEVVFHDGIRHIDTHAFRDNTRLTKVTVKNADIAYGDGVFENVAVVTFCGVPPPDMQRPSEPCDPVIACPAGQVVDDPYATSASCVECPPNTFQTSDNFRGIDCTPHTWEDEKILKEVGTSTSDNVWEPCPGDSVYRADGTCSNTKEAIQDCLCANRL